MRIYFRSRGVKRGSFLVFLLVGGVMGQIDAGCQITRLGETRAPLREIIILLVCLSSLSENARSDVPGNRRARLSSTEIFTFHACRSSYTILASTTRHTSGNGEINVGTGLDSKINAVTVGAFAFVKVGPRRP